MRSQVCSKSRTKTLRRLRLKSKWSNAERMLLLLKFCSKVLFKKWWTRCIWFWPSRQPILSSVCVVFNSLRSSHHVQSISSSHGPRRHSWRRLLISSAKRTSMLRRPSPRKTYTPTWVRYTRRSSKFPQSTSQWCAAQSNAHLRVSSHSLTCILHFNAKNSRSSTKRNRTSSKDSIP